MLLLELDILQTAEGSLYFVSELGSDDRVNLLQHNIQ